MKIVVLWDYNSLNRIKKYRLSNEPVPRSALLELANTISIHMEKNIELKNCLKEVFFNAIHILLLY